MSTITLNVAEKTGPKSAVLQSHSKDFYYTHLVKALKTTDHVYLDLSGLEHMTSGWINNIIFKLVEDKLFERVSIINISNNVWFHKIFEAIRMATNSDYRNMVAEVWTQAESDL